MPIQSSTVQFAGRYATIVNQVKAIRISGVDSKPGAELFLSKVGHSDGDKQLGGGKYVKLPHLLNREFDRIVREKKPIRAYAEVSCGIQAEQ